MKMDDKLKCLNSSMKKTVLKDLNVDKRELKRNILQRSKNRGTIFNFNSIGKWTRTVTSAVSIVILCFVIGILGFSEELSPDKQQGNNNQSDKNETPQQAPSVTQEELYPWEDKLKPSKEYPDKFQIVKKMHYSNHYVHTAQGSYEFFPSPGGKNKIEFYVNFDKHMNRSIHQDFENGKLKETLHYLFKDEVMLRKKIEEKIFNHKTFEKSHHQDKDYFIHSSTGKFTGAIFDSEWDFLIYNNYENWSYTEGEKFGMPAYFIEGVVTEDMSEGLAGPFTMVIAKETGALLDLKAYGQSDEPRLSLTIINIQINQGVLEEVFKLDVTGYKEMPNFDFNISGIENYQEKPGGVDTSSKID
ncbi:hypothetical protein ACFO3D_04405 [Virgibacillus kekensis]|uniref:ECF-type sigma factor negative effector n=1 Tax=Virgibacillus kekensis TaxID=202261 RepID=A0ABV9DGF4_9BACI